MSEEDQQILHFNHVNKYKFYKDHQMVVFAIKWNDSDIVKNANEHVAMISVMFAILRADAERV